MPAGVASDPSASRLGWWPQFYRDWKAATPAERDAAFAATLEYRAGTISGLEEIAEVSQALGIVIPA